MAQGNGVGRAAAGGSGKVPWRRGWRVRHGEWLQPRDDAGQVTIFGKEARSA